MPRRGLRSREGVGKATHTVVVPNAASPAAPTPGTDRRHLTRYAWLSVATAVVTITLKTGAYLLTGSVGLLSDAAESVVNLVAALVAVVALTVAARPADSMHPFGHAKAEYFSAVVEGAMILVASAFIISSAAQRLLDPQPLENVGGGLGISVLASVLNGVVATVLIRVGRAHRSLTLVADGRHLLTDVWTSVGVVIGVALVAVTGIWRLDAIVAIVVGVNILFTGYRLIRESVVGLMDTAWDEHENARLAGLLASFGSDVVRFHALRTRQAGHQRFAEVHVLVPGEWSVRRGHDLIEDVEDAVRTHMEDVHLTCHLEPLEDPRSYDDYPAQVNLPGGKEIVPGGPATAD